MGEHFIKAYCARSKRYYGLKIEEVDGVQKVTDCYDISPEDAKRLASNIDVPGLQSAPNLRECAGCHTRSVAGCSCAKSRWDCRPGTGYHFQCLYCSELHIFSVDEGAEVVDEANIGKKITLAQGQEVEISAAGAAALEHILVGVGWDIALQGSSMDVDSSVFVLGPGSAGELIYFGNLKHSSGCVIHRGDNLVGGKKAGNEGDDSENIDVFLRKVPDSYDRLYFVLNIYSSSSRGQSFRDVRNLYIRLTNAKNGQELASYKVSQEMMDKTGLIIAKAYRQGGKWFFKAIGRPVDVTSVDAMRAYCID